MSLVSPGKATPFPKLHEKPDLENFGISFNLANNIWGTNCEGLIPSRLSSTFSTCGLAAFGL